MAPLCNMRCYPCGAVAGNTFDVNVFQHCSPINLTAVGSLPEVYEDFQLRVISSGQPRHFVGRSLHCYIEKLSMGHLLNSLIYLLGKAFSRSLLSYRLTKSKQIHLCTPLETSTSSQPSPSLAVACSVLISHR